MLKSTEAGDPRKKWVSQLRKGSLEMCMLGVLESRARYGFEIVQFLNESGLAITEGTIYPLLNRMQGEEMIEAQWQESASGPPRKYYALTATGRDELGWMRAEWLQYSEAVAKILAAGNEPNDAQTGRPLQVAPRPQPENG